MINNPDDTPQQLLFPTGFRPKFFGRDISQPFFYASPNGYISFESDESSDGNLETHFSAARISIFMTDLLKDDTCIISYNQPTGTMDAVTITWSECHEYYDEGKLHSFQLSFFRNGDITMFFKDVTPTGADIVVGLSDDIAPIIGSLKDTSRLLDSLDNTATDEVKGLTDGVKDHHIRSHHHNIASLNAGRFINTLAPARNSSIDYIFLPCTLQIIAP
jgi:hypothetical protein